MFQTKITSNMSNEELFNMSKEEANLKLSSSDKYLWVQLHNVTANNYFIKNNQIVNVEPAGWWY